MEVSSKLHASLTLSLRKDLTLTGIQWQQINKKGQLKKNVLIQAHDVYVLSIADNAKHQSQ
jgi:hypothetical protein